MNNFRQIRKCIKYLESDNYDFIILAIDCLEKLYPNNLSDMVKFIRKHIPSFSDNQVYLHDNKIYCYSIEKDDIISKLKPLQTIYNIAMNKMNQINF